MTEIEWKARAESYCSTAEHCRLEVKNLLERYGAGRDAIESILGYLERERFIDERRYARAFVHDKVRFAKWGRAKIAQALWLKQIPKEIAQQALAQIDMDEYMEILREVVRAKYATSKGNSLYERMMKTMKTVCGRGFEPLLVRQVLELPDCDCE